MRIEGLLEKLLVQFKTGIKHALRFNIKMNKPLELLNRQIGPTKSTASFV